MTMTKKQINNIIRDYVEGKLDEFDLEQAISPPGELKKRSSAILYSDSQYVVYGITKGWAKNWRSNGWVKSDKKLAINPDLWDKLLELYEKHDQRQLLIPLNDN